MQDLSRLLDDVYGSDGSGGDAEPGGQADPPSPPPAAGDEDDAVRDDDGAELDGLLGLRDEHDTPPRGQASILDLDADLDDPGRDDRTTAVPVLDADDHGHTEAVPVLRLDHDDLGEDPTTAVPAFESGPVVHGDTEAVPVLDLDDRVLDDRDLDDRDLDLATIGTTDDGGRSADGAWDDDDPDDEDDDTGRGWVREDDDILPRARPSRWRLPRR